MSTRRQAARCILGKVLSTECVNGPIRRVQCAPEYILASRSLHYTTLLCVYADIQKVVSRSSTWVTRMYMYLLVHKYLTDWGHPSRGCAHENVYKNFT